MNTALDYKKSIKELTEIQNIEIENCRNWLSNYFDLYTQTLLFYSCSTKEPKLPCYCEKRKVDCLFLDIYNAMKTQIFEYYNDTFVIRLINGKKNGKYHHFILRVEKTAGNNV